MAVSAPTDSFLPAELTASSFTLQNDHSLFTILRKNIYSDTILAPIRELSTNAIDACIEGNLDVSWSVHIPTLDEPYFEVRDYGPGMSIDFLEGDFNIVGASSKRSSNRTNGQFGLGRLSPLAYTSSFTLDSYNNGMHYSYLVSIKDGIPCTLQLSVLPSNEPSGCRFSFTVEPTDISRFHQKAANLYKYFDHKPTTNIELPAVEIFLDGDFCMLTDDRSGIVMANVYYPLERAHVPTRYDNLVLKVPTGSVALTPGRESLNYDQDTVTYLRQLVSDAEAELVDLSNELIAAAPTQYAAGKLYQDLYNKTPYPYTQKLMQPLMTPTFNVTKRIPIHSPLFETVVKVPAYKNLRPASSAYVRDSWFYSAAYLVVDQRSYTHCLDELPSNVVVFKPAPADVQAAIELLTAYGLPNFHLASSFEIPEKAPRESRKVVGLNMKLLNRSGNYPYEGGTIYYIPYNGVSPAINVNESALYNFIRYLGYDYPVYGIAQSNLPKIAGDSRFINLFDLLKEDYKDQTILLPNVDREALDLFRRYSDASVTNILTAPSCPEDLHTTFTYFKALSKLDSLRYTASTFKALEPYISMHDWVITPSCTFSAMEDKYPLLGDYRYCHNNRLLHYLNLEVVYANSLSATS